MLILLGKTAGFCKGVKMAIDHTKEELRKLKPNEKLFCLGELVHNNQVIQQLKEMGLMIVNTIQEVPDRAKLIIRAHGITKEVYQTIKEKEIVMIDLTCPSVLKTHQLATIQKEKGVYIFFIGVKEHPETIGTISFCGRDSYTIETQEDIEQASQAFIHLGKQQGYLLAQTTFSMETFEELVKKLQDNIEKQDNSLSLEINNTICQSTKRRQEETKALAKKVELQIVMGGTHSSNTKKLYEISRENCPKVIQIETKEEIEIQKIKNYQTIGIMAGASTPKESVEELVEYLKKEK